MIVRKIIGFIVAIFWFPAMGMEDLSPRIPITIGIELELQKTEYQPPQTIIKTGLVDHIRLFESKDQIDEKPVWYLEADGSGALEFVTSPIPLDKKNLLVIAFKQINKLMKEIIENSFPSDDLDFKKFTIESNEENALGTWVHKVPKLGRQKVTEWEELKDNIEICLKDPTLTVRPQITFEIPANFIGIFTRYMSHKHLPLFKAASDVEKVINLPASSNFILGNNGKALAYFLALTTELLRYNYSEMEQGPKGAITLLSRRSFKSMYNQLNQDEQEEFKSEFEKYLNTNSEQSNSEKSLFKQPYKLFFGRGENTFDLYEEGKDIKGVEYITSILKKQTIGDLYKSIVSQEQFQRNECNNLLVKALNQVIANNGRLEKGLQQDITDIKSGVYDNIDGDLLSPPLFLPNYYSLGKEDGEISNNNFIIEMRGYNARYPEMHMGNQLYFWLNNELNIAESYWENVDSENIKDTDKKYKEMKDAFNKAEQKVYSLRKTLNGFVSALKRPLEKLEEKGSEEIKISNKYKQTAGKEINSFFDENKSTYGKALHTEFEFAKAILGDVLNKTEENNE